MTTTNYNWRDALGHPLSVGDRVTYVRKTPQAGGSCFVVGTITGPANLSPDLYVQVDLTDRSMEILKHAADVEVKLQVRKRLPSQHVPSVCTWSTIKVNGDDDVCPNVTGASK